MATRFPLLEPKDANLQCANVAEGEGVGKRGSGLRCSTHDHFAHDEPSGRLA